jgi:hypothetical protein
MVGAKKDRRKPPSSACKSPKNSHTSAAEIKRQQRIKEAMELRLIGHSYEKIGEELTCSTATAFRMVDEGLKAITQETGEKLLIMERERLNLMQAAIFPNAVAGDMAAITTQLRIQDRRSRYEGLDKPVKMASTDPEGNAVPTGAAPPPVFIIFSGKPAEAPPPPAAPKEPETDKG